MSTGQFSLTDAQPVAAPGGSGRYKLSDATANPTARDAQGTKGGGGAPQPTMEQLSPSTKQPSPVSIGGMAREGALGLASGFTGLPESTSPFKTASESMEKGSLGYQLGSAVGGHQPLSYIDLVKQHNPLTSAIDTAKGLYGAGKEIATAPDAEGIAHGTGSFIGQLLQLSSLMKGGDRAITPEVTQAARLVERHTAISDAQTSVVNEQVRKPLQILNRKISTAIGKQVDPVLRADELHMQLTNNPAGYVNAVEASTAAQKASSTMGGDFPARIANFIDRAKMPMSLRDAKALTTEVGDAAARAGGKEHAVLTTLYDGLHEATWSRADDLGKVYGDAWQNYIDQARSWKQMRSGVAGELMDPDAKHSAVLDKLIHPDNGTEINAIVKKMKQYNLDPKPLIAAREIGTDLATSADNTRNAFIGKIRAIQKYPVVVGGAASATSVIGRLSHVPGAAYILPLLMAGKIGGMLDMAHIKIILSDIKRNNPSESFDPHATYQVDTGQWKSGEAKPGPIPPEATAGGITAPPTKGATPGEAADMGDAQQAEEERQLMARKLSRTKRSRGASK